MPTSRTKSVASAVKETSAEYEVSETHYLPVHDKLAALDAIFHDPDVKYGLACFADDIRRTKLDLWQRGEKFYLHCLKRAKKVLAKPEEVIRQLALRQLLDAGYALEQISLEVPIKMGSTLHSKAADIVVYREVVLRLTPYVIVELKQRRAARPGSARKLHGRHRRPLRLLAEREGSTISPSPPARRRAVDDVRAAAKRDAATVSPVSAGRTRVCNAGVSPSIGFQGDLAPTSRAHHGDDEDH